MRKTLADIMTASRDAGCPIVHISMLAGDEAFVASRPCLGDASAPLLSITPDDYLALMAEIRNTMLVEYDESHTFTIYTAGARDPRAAQERLPLPPRTIAGTVDAGGTTAAVFYMMDSGGQETTVIYDGLRSFADIQAYWKQRGELVRAFCDEYEPSEGDVNALCSQLDRTTKLTNFDLNCFAHGRGLEPALRYVSAR
jgi:hypothetical protein